MGEVWRSLLRGWYQAPLDKEFTLFLQENGLHSKMGLVGGKMPNSKERFPSGDIVIKGDGNGVARPLNHTPLLPLCR